MKRTLLGTSLWIDQKKSQAFNLDTILLADFIKIPYRTKQIADFGTGAGALMLYLSQKTQASIFGLEVQEERALWAKNNIMLNHLEDRLSVFHQDVRCHTLTQLDMVVSNPPFFKVTDQKNFNEDLEETIARHEVLLDLDSLIQAAKRALKFGGQFYMIHRPDRFAEICLTLKKHQFEIKRVRFVHPYLDEQANHVLIHAIKNGQSGLVLEPPLIIYEKPHVLTQEIEEIYGGRSYVTQSIKPKRKT